jgi:AbrB family looped-hinge helix DNA binding protein
MLYYKYYLSVRGYTLANKVGTKGQIVIAKELRDKLGIKPGWVALQRLSGDHIEFYFIPPEHKKSLKGSLAGHTKIRVQSGKDWEQAREIAWQKAAQEKMPLPEKA